MLCGFNVPVKELNFLCLISITGVVSLLPMRQLLRKSAATCLVNSNYLFQRLIKQDIAFIALQPQDPHMHLSLYRRIDVPLSYLYGFY